MSSMDNLAEALRLKREQDEATSVPASQLAKQWEQSLALLFNQLENWLKPLVDTGGVKIVRHVKIKEESPNPDVHVSYETPMMVIEINHKTAVVETIGLYVGGTAGRVALIGDDKRFLLSRSLSSPETWIISTYLNSFDTAPSVERPLTEDSLAEALGHFL